MVCRFGRPARSGPQARLRAVRVCSTLALATALVGVLASSFQSLTASSYQSQKESKKRKKARKGEPELAPKPHPSSLPFFESAANLRPGALVGVTLALAAFGAAWEFRRRLGAKKLQALKRPYKIPEPARAFAADQLKEPAVELSRVFTFIQDAVLRPMDERLPGRPFEYDFHSFPFTPMVLIIGNHSSGKSTLINRLLGRDLQETGVAPTDDGFTILERHERDQQEDGPTVLGCPENRPFAELRKFGQIFSGHLKRKRIALPEDSLVPFGLQIVDTPGMIDLPAGSSNSSRGRGYNFVDVVRWWAKRSDLILLLFDPDKPGTTGETLEVLTKSLDGLNHKFLIVLNKVDRLDNSVDFARAYGALGWALSKVIKWKDIPQIYTIYNEGFENTNSTTSLSLSMEAFSEKREEVIAEVLRIPERHNDNIITALEETLRQVEVACTVLQSFRARVRRRRFLLQLVGILLFWTPCLTAAWLFLVGHVQLPGAWACFGVVMIYLSVCCGCAMMLKEFYTQYLRLLMSSVDVVFKECYAQHFIHGDGEDYQHRWESVSPKVRNILVSVESATSLPVIHSWEISQIWECLEKDVWYLRQIARQMREGCHCRTDEERKMIPREEKAQTSRACRTLAGRVRGEGAPVASQAKWGAAPVRFSSAGKLAAAAAADRHPEEVRGARGMVPQRATEEVGKEDDEQRVALETLRAQEELRRQAMEETQRALEEVRRRAADEARSAQQECRKRALEETQRTLEDAKHRASKDARGACAEPQQRTAQEKAKQQTSNEATLVREDARQRAAEEARRGREEAKQAALEECWSAQVEIEQRAAAEERRAREQADRGVAEEARWRAEENAKQQALAQTQGGQRTAEQKVPKEAKQHVSGALTCLGETQWRKLEEAKQMASEDVRIAEEETEQRATGDAKHRASEHARIAQEEAKKRAADEANRKALQDAQIAHEQAKQRESEEARQRALEQAQTTKEQAKRQAAEDARQKALEQSRISQDQARHRAAEEAKQQALERARTAQEVAKGPAAEKAQQEALEQAQIDLEEVKQRAAEEAKQRALQEQEEGRQRAAEEARQQALEQTISASEELKQPALTQARNAQEEAKHRAADEVRQEALDSARRVHEDVRPRTLPQTRNAQGDASQGATAATTQRGLEDAGRRAAVEARMDLDQADRQEADRWEAEQLAAEAKRRKAAEARPAVDARRVQEDASCWVVQEPVERRIEEHARKPCIEAPQQTAEEARRVAVAAIQRQLEDDSRKAQVAASPRGNAQGPQRVPEQAQPKEHEHGAQRCAASQASLVQQKAQERQLLESRGARERFAGHVEGVVDAKKALEEAEKRALEARRAREICERRAQGRSLEEAHKAKEDAQRLAAERALITEAAKWVKEEREVAEHRAPDEVASMLGPAEMASVPGKPAIARPPPHSKAEQPALLPL